jgi:hypothetical protein
MHFPISHEPEMGGRHARPYEAALQFGNARVLPADSILVDLLRYTITDVYPGPQ